MIIVTGAAGFIGSGLVRYLNDAGYHELVIVDEFSRADKLKNLEHKQFVQKVHRDDFFDFFEKNATQIKFVFHIGARTDTTEMDVDLFNRLNLNYTKTLWTLCTKFNIPLVYASSAATYGLGELGYEDNHSICSDLKPLNPYGRSKNDFDIWALEQNQTPPFWAGLKFFNVYGPNEYHKARMASVILHTLRQIKATGGMRLFRSHRADFENGAQSRDFIYVKDVLQICMFLMQKKPKSGLYNVGTGNARTFLDLASQTFLAMNETINISFIDTPKDIRDTYQYFTEANMSKLKAAGYDTPFYSLEAGISDYVTNYLLEGKYL